MKTWFAIIDGDADGNNNGIITQISYTGHPGAAVKNLYPYSIDYAGPYDTEDEAETGLRDVVSCARERGLDIDMPSSRSAAILGKKGGSVKSERKAASSAENGKKGGRPRKTPE